MGASSSRQSSQKSLKLREDKRNTQGKAKTKSTGLGQNKHSPKQESPNQREDIKAVAKVLDIKQSSASRVKAWENSPVGSSSLHSAQRGHDKRSNNNERQMEDQKAVEEVGISSKGVCVDCTDAVKSTSEPKARKIKPGELYFERDGRTPANSSVAQEPPLTPLPGQTSGGLDPSNVVTVHEVYNFLNDGAATPHIHDPTYILLLDAREKTLFQKSHIVLARTSSSLYTDLLSTNIYGYVRDESQIANRLKEFTLVIVYGNKVLDMSNRVLPEVKLLTELASYGVEPLLLSTGFESFSNAFPFLCTSQEFKKDWDLKSMLVHPSVFIAEQLYQGRGDQATNAKVVENLKLTHIVNIGREHPNAFPGRLTYLTIKLDDVSHSNLQIYFPESTQFIEEAILKGGRVLVHCNMGVSRSSTISIAYLMKSRQWMLKTAFEFIKDKRSCVRPNRGFLLQLSEWEQVLFGKKETDIDELWF